MAKIDAALEARLRADPAAPARLILRTDEEPGAVAERLRQRGIHVVRQFRLIKALAVTGQASELLSLADEPWITAIEEDREVRAL